MNTLIETASLAEIKAAYLRKKEMLQRRIILCAGTGCIANGALKVMKAFENEIVAGGLNVALELKEEPKEKTTLISGSGCQGFCAQGPLVTILPDNILYNKVRENDVKEIVEKTLLNNEIIDRLLYENPATGAHCKGHKDIPFYNLQNRLVLGECGMIDATDIEEYIAGDGYSAIEKAVKEMSPENLCNLMLESGLRGRGGGGFPTGKKWQLTLKENNEKKYVICNGDEGDPGAFMDRSIMEGNPHRVIEGMMIAAHAIGADEGYVYVRMEYPLAVERMITAIEDAEKYGILGDNIFGTGKSMRITVMEGAGAFVCGEETALIASIEGKRGMPMPKPPYPAQKGLWEKPTVINNVETLAAVPLIVRNGAKWFNVHGTENSKGTKTFALTGHVANTGLIEVPFGTTLREIVFNIGGGVTTDDGKLTGDGFKAIQIGGPSGGCLTRDELDLPIDYANLIKAGTMVGSGGMVVMNNKTCIIQISRYFMQFTQNESCGKCVPCREGTKQMLALLDDIIEGRATMKTFSLLEELAKVVKSASLCGLGKSAPNPVLSTISKFRTEYEEHIIHKFCRTNNCKALITVSIDAEKCTGCTACARKCPVGAITGNKKELHVIDATICTKCGICKATCKFNAINGLN